jgi:hypothetical protein
LAEQQGDALWLDITSSNLENNLFASQDQIV